jgi:hypothetical protein
VIAPKVEMYSFMAAALPLMRFHSETLARRFFQSALSPVQFWSPAV